MEDVKINQEEENKQKSKRVHFCYFSSRFFDDEGNKFIDVATVEKAITTHVSIKNAVYYIHDADPISQYDKETDANGDGWNATEDGLKPPHIHVVLDFGKASVSISNIAKWFGIPEYMICFQNRKNQQSDAIVRDPFMHKVAYGTHEFEPDELGKHIYPRSVCILFGERKETIWLDIDKWYGHRAELKKYELSKEEINLYIDDVANKGMTLRQVQEIIGSAIFIRNEDLFKRARRHYVRDVKPMPGLRTVFYVESVSQNKDVGKGGAGKTVCTHALAKQLASEFNADVHKPYEELVREGFCFDLGTDGVGLQSYDGQEVFVLNEMDAYTMFKTFGRRGTKELLDSFPTRQDSNIKYGSTVITAKYIIINGIERFDKFVKGIAGAYDDRKADDKAIDQYYRRFFCDIKLVNEDYMDILFNKGVLDDTREYNEYYAIRHVYAPFSKTIKKYDIEVCTALENKIFQPVIEKTREFENKTKNKIGINDDEVNRLMKAVDQNQSELRFEDIGDGSQEEELEQLEYDNPFTLEERMKELLKKYLDLIAKRRILDAFIFKDNADYKDVLDFYKKTYAHYIQDRKKDNYEILSNLRLQIGPKINEVEHIFKDKGWNIPEDDYEIYLNSKEIKS